MGVELLQKNIYAKDQLWGGAGGAVCVRKRELHLCTPITAFPLIVKIHPT